MQAPWAYEEYGSGRPLLLGTSYLWDARMWQPQIAALSAQHRIIVPLLPGHGNDVTLAPHITDPAAMATEVGTLLDRLGIDEFAMAGLSVGGMWAAELALQRPRQVQALVLMDTFLGAEPAQSLQHYSALLDAIERAGQVPAPLADQVVPLFFRPGIASDDPARISLQQALLEWPASRIPALLALGRVTFNRPERLQALAELDPARTLVMVGEHDIPRPPYEAEAMAAVIGCACERIANAGHIASLENPDAVTQRLQEHLRRAWPR